MILDGKAIARQIQEELKVTILQINGRKPCLAIVQVGEHLPSQIYVSRKMQACVEIGMETVKKHLSSTASEADLLKEIAILNHDPQVDGFLVQLPLPPHINPFKIIEAIHPEKDVDGFHPMNIGKLLIGETDGFFPSTPLGIQVLLERSEVNLAGKHVVVVGRSNIVGKPIAAMLMQNSPGGNATVTIIHRHSQNIETLCRMADVLIVAIGQPAFIKENMVKEGAVVVDVGINKIPSNNEKGYKIIGDVDFERVKSKCALITPVPGGVGPMTIAMLLSNTVKSYLKRLSP